MDKQTKNLITRDSVEKELRFFNRADYRSAVVASCVMSAVFLPITYAILRSLFNSEMHVLLRILLALLVAFLVASPSWGSLLALAMAIMEKRRLDRGEFEISTCRLLYKREKPVQRHVEEMLVFADFEECAVSHTQYQLAAGGDVFYLVHLRNKKKVKLLYSAKMYDYQE